MNRNNMPPGVPAGGVPLVGQQKLPIENIVLLDSATQKRIVLEMQDDITAKEAADLAVMFAVMNVPQNWDFAKYIEDHGLTRHFKSDKEDTPVAQSGRE